MIFIFLAGLETIFKKCILIVLIDFALVNGVPKHFYFWKNKDDQQKRFGKWNLVMQRIHDLIVFTAENEHFQNNRISVRLVWLHVTVWCWTIR